MYPYSSKNPWSSVVRSFTLGTLNCSSVVEVYPATCSTWTSFSIDIYKVDPGNLSNHTGTDFWTYHCLTLDFEDACKFHQVNDSKLQGQNFARSHVEHSSWKEKTNAWCTTTSHLLLHKTWCAHDPITWQWNTNLLQSWSSPEKNALHQGTGTMFTLRKQHVALQEDVKVWTSSMKDTGFTELKEWCSNVVGHLTALSSQFPSLTPASSTSPWK